MSLVLSLSLSAYAAFLACCLRAVAGCATRSPQRLIPEDILIASMRHAMVHHIGRCHASFLFAVPAQRELGEMTEPRLLPSVAVPTLRCGQAFTPSVRVQHLDRLRTDLTRSCGLHGDPGLSHQRAPGGIGLIPPIWPDRSSGWYPLPLRSSYTDRLLSPVGLALSACGAI